MKIKMYALFSLFVISSLFAPVPTVEAQNVTWQCAYQNYCGFNYWGNWVCWQRQQCCIQWWDNYTGQYAWRCEWR